MDNIAKRIASYMDKHPLGLGDTDCETVLDQLYQAYAESHESDPSEIGEGFKELEDFLCTLRLMIRMQSSTFAAAFAPPTNIKPSLMAYNTVHI